MCMHLKASQLTFVDWSRKYGFHRLVRNRTLTCVGQAMAANIQKFLAKEGYPPLIVWNRTPSRADPLKEHGVLVAKSLEEAVEKSDIIFTCVHISLYTSLI